MITLRLTETEAADVHRALSIGRKFIQTTHRIDDVREAIEHQLPGLPTRAPLPAGH